MKFILSTLISLLVLLPVSYSQKIDNPTIANRLKIYKNDLRGPYRDIRWFCKDGSVLPPKEKCPQPGGVQRARYKEEVEMLAKTNHVFLGQILANTPQEDFWDEANYHSRLKQYQLERYLKSVDNGWVQRRSQYYRGAFQQEDEEAWGIAFFHWILAKDEAIKKHFFLLRQAIKDIPHQGDNDKTLEVRALSKIIAEAYPSFMDLRVKIHGQPEFADIEKVRQFRAKNRSKLTPELNKKFDRLIGLMEEIYKPIDIRSLDRYMQQLPKESVIYGSLLGYTSAFNKLSPGAIRARLTAEKIAEIRREILNIKGKQARLALMDLSQALEEIFFVEAGKWEPQILAESCQKIQTLGQVAVGTGFLEEWEWEQIGKDVAPTKGENLSLPALTHFLERARSMVEWGTGMVNANYRSVINLYGGFEPLAYGFFDNMIRSSVLLPLGSSVSQLGDFVARESKLGSKLLDLPNASSLRGLNPGFAMGELVIVDKNEDEVEVSNNKIYVFNHPPSDLKPVAGILTVSEGNMVSHVQLLARNLGIPNAVLSLQNMEDLKAYAGKKVFYAVSNRGTVIMKTAEAMSSIEKELFAVKKRTEERVSVPIEKIKLNQTSILDMRKVDASFSGKLCGPKAANLGQLKQMFPDHVVEGIVIPFGIFRKHLDQNMPGHTGSYWNFLEMAFKQASLMRKSGSKEEEVEAYTLQELTKLREAIQKIELLPEFMAELETGFSTIFGAPLGKVPVFLRSDTNMEDLKEFTGAGLNLTLFNVVSRAKIIQGIKDVWASPYTERSFKWRQRYLLNPENVFPSILIIPSVDVASSGVMITKGIPNNDIRDITIAFSRGAGGAVDGQAAESYLLQHDGTDILLSPAREAFYRRLPKSGGSNIMQATFETPILAPQEREAMRSLAKHMQERIPKETGAENTGPYDVELGFLEGKLWLFQIRPFVENKSALSSSYLESISPKTKTDTRISVQASIK